MRGLPGYSRVQPFCEKMILVRLRVATVCLYIAARAHSLTNMYTLRLCIEARANQQGYAVVNEVRLLRGAYAHVCTCTIATAQGVSIRQL